MFPNFVVLSNLNKLLVIHWVGGVKRVSEATGEGITVTALVGDTEVHPLDGLIVTKAEKFPNFVYWWVVFEKLVEFEASPNQMV
jgi:hypothetical protein